MTTNTDTTSGAGQQGDTGPDGQAQNGATQPDSSTSDGTGGNGTSNGSTGQWNLDGVNNPESLLGAYEAEKQKRKDASTAREELQQQYDALKAQVDGREAEHQRQQEDQRVKDEALSAANERILKAEVRAAAAAKLTDPADALLYIDLSGFEVGSDGEVDGDAIATAIDDLMEKKPYLAAQGKRFQGSADGGARNDATRPKQLTQSDLDRMSPEEISQAKKDGRCDDLLGVKH